MPAKKYKSKSRSRSGGKRESSEYDRFRAAHKGEFDREGLKRAWEQEKRRTNYQPKKQQGGQMMAGETGGNQWTEFLHANGGEGRSRGDLAVLYKQYKSDKGLTKSGAPDKRKNGPRQQFYRANFARVYQQVMNPNRTSQENFAEAASRVAEMYNGGGAGRRRK